MQFLLSHLPSPGISQVPCLHFSNLERQSGLWACQFWWGWLHPFCMRGQMGYSLSVVRVWFDRPIRRRAALPPTFLWLIPTVSLMQIARSYWLPRLVRCFGGIKGWNIGFYYWAPNRKSWRLHYQIEGRCQLQLSGGFQTDTRYFSKWIWWHPCPWC